MNLLSRALLTLALLTSIGACAAEVGGGEFVGSCDDGQCDSVSRRAGYAVEIRDTAAEDGLTNAALLAGIAEVETTLAHCWSEATWACKGPASSSCGGGPVIAGSADGSCSQQQGGLGMFQFDGGTYAQTMAEYGDDIVTLRGNIRSVVPFLLERAVESVPGISTQQEALDWMNSIAIVDGDPDFEEWLMFISWRFNGCKGCTRQANKYRAGTHALVAEMGADFWGSQGGTSPGNGSFIGTDCSLDEDICEFSRGGRDGECLDWFDADSNSLSGYCSMTCEGTCPDASGFAPTYCADFRGEGGMCATTPTASNGFCDDVPGTVLQVVPRFVGNSGVAEGWKGVCAPPGNATMCETAEGQGGECFDTDTMTCGGTLHSGLCPGGANIQCCTR